jgi:hypothetical protein
MAHRTLRTAQREAAFLKLLAKGENVSAAAAAIGIGRRTAFDWKATGGEFAAAWNEALERQTEQIESVLFKKAKAGDLLACIFWLKAHKPELYNRRMMIAIGGDPDMLPIQLQHSGEQARRVFIARTEPEEPCVIEYDVAEMEAAEAEAAEKKDEVA